MISEKIRREMERLEAMLRAQQERFEGSGCEELFSSSPVDRPSLGEDRLNHEVKWNSVLFGMMTVAVQEPHGFGNSQKVDRFTLVVPISLSGNPDHVDFRLTVVGGEKIKVLTAQNGQVTERVGNQEVNLSFPIEWKDGGPRGKKVPSIIKGKRDTDVLLLDTNGNRDGRKGAFIQMEVSLVTRNGGFWLCLQQVFAGQVVSTTETKAKEVGLNAVHVGNHWGSVVPLFPENAYPGMNFFGPFGYLAPSFVVAAIECGAYVPLSRCVIAKWGPEDKDVSENLKTTGWTRAWVSWFNPVVGYGFLFCEDGGAPCFLHFKQIEDPTGRPVWRGALTFPSVTPMRAVALKYETQLDGKRKATAVRPL